MARKPKSKAHVNGSLKRAGGYVRVSSERQADTASPEEQEADIRAYCEAHGYTLVEMYRDTERYRVGGRLVEPSGTRSDRPQLRRLLADVDDDKIDVIVAWREDRLYRGANHAMLEISERVKRGVVDVELVKEHYDATTAPVKAWAAGIELEARHDRFAMGMASRLNKGKCLSNSAPYGYRKGEDGRLEIDPEEAAWVKFIYQNYAAGMPMVDIRRALIKNGAKQRHRRPDAKTPEWSKAIFYDILRNRCYHTGKQIVKWDTEVFEVPVPILVDAETVCRCDERRQKTKCYPARNVKYDYLVAGLAYCAACGLTLRARAYFRHGGGKPERITPQVRYCCQRHTQYHDNKEKGCCVGVSAHKLDAAVWEKVCALILEPGELERRLAERIEELRAGQADVSAKSEQLQARLDDLAIQRQWVIAKARQGKITENDMDTQLAAITIEQGGLERELNDLQLMAEDRAGQMIEFARQYREQVALGLAGLNDTPSSEEEAHDQFLLRRRFVESLVARVDVLADKTPVVHIRVDLQPRDGTSVGAMSIQKEPVIPG
jgi:site-specific DNA recombinase